MTLFVTTGRRHFMRLIGGALAASGIAATAWPLINSLNPPRGAEEDSNVYLDLSALDRDRDMRTVWRSTSIIIVRRTAAQLEALREIGAVNSRPEPIRYVAGFCSNDGETPLSTAHIARHLDWDGFLCPFCGTSFDLAGRRRIGAGANLPIPPYRLLEDNRLLIGENPPASA